MTGGSKLIGIVLVVSLGVMVAGLFVYKSVQDEISRASEESQPHAILRVLDRFTAHLVKTEDGAQGYIITGDSTYLEHYSANLGLIGTDYKQLCAFSGRTPTMERCVTSLDSLLNKKLLELSTCIELRRNFNMIKPAADFMKKHKSRLLRDSIQSMVQDLQQEQRELLQQSAITGQTTGFFPLWWGLGSAAIVLLVFVVFSVALQRSQSRDIRTIANLIEQMMFQEIPAAATTSVSEAFYPLLQAIQGLSHTQHERTSSVNGLYNQLLESLNASPHGFVVARSLRSGSLTGKNQITDFEVSFCNTAAVRLLSGKTPPGPGKRLTQILHPTYTQAILERYAHVVETGISTTADEVYHQTFFAVTAIKFETGLLILYVPHSHH